MSDDETKRQLMREIGLTEEQIDKVFAQRKLQMTQTDRDRLSALIADDITNTVPHSIDTEGVQHFDVDALKQRLCAWMNTADRMDEDDEADEGDNDIDDERIC
jgi:hypothetical protein